jgi:hypothetical protein
MDILDLVDTNVNTYSSGNDGRDSYGVLNSRTPLNDMQSKCRATLEQIVLYPGMSVRAPGRAARAAWAATSLAMGILNGLQLT